MAKDSDSTLRGIQEEHWATYQKVDREWPTPHLEGDVREALQSPVPKKILVVGIGGLAKDALSYAEIADTEIVGVDINRQAVQMALEIPKRDGVTFLEENILDPNISDRLGAESFGAVTMVGLLTNLVTDRDAQLALDHTNRLLAPGGSVVLSDYALGEDPEYWIGRYERDAAVLEQAGLGDRRANFGTLIIRPGNLNPDDMGYVTASNTDDVVRTAESVRAGHFDRLVRHRPVNTFLDLLARSGFERLTEPQIVSLQTPRPAGKTTPWDFSNNIQIRGVKPVI